MRAGETADDAEDLVDSWDTQWFGSTEAASRRRLKLDMGSSCRPKKGEHPLGEDAHFVSEERNAFGIADGVGGWSRNGVDAGEFARQLMSSCKVELERTGGGRATGPVLRAVLKKALAKTTARGTSTACVAAVDGRLLRAINVGDSGFMVVRGDTVAYRSPLHQYSFNIPYQIGGVDKATPIERAVELATELAPGDVVVAGSDGLLDNLFEQDIVEIVARKRAEGLGGTAEEMARALAAAAEDAYVTGQESPFGEASRAARISWSGSKPDDVTVVVAKVCTSRLLSSLLLFSKGGHRH
ncbi:unnamed protein product [Spirodela intermedia]|uniref:Protein phosphatase n=1 Tax=Spirodela intermedia TaxID=51605 RepID=A0A7I8JQT9_SPIIN|nr:unnamed protein product [Spirodela intermedia]CAA6672510.1 unnamed protein product [Spirodela intermedia]